MKIECKLIRDGGTFVTLGGTNYHFAPTVTAGGVRHIAEVKDKEHIERLLSIPEAYRLYDEPVEPPQEDEAPKQTRRTRKKAEDPAEDPVEQPKADETQDEVKAEEGQGEAGE